MNNARLHIKDFLKVIGFQVKDGESNAWYKKFKNHKDYEIKITLQDNLQNSKIDWGGKIKVGRKTTSNFSQSETLVILECVSRLLEKGYKPESLILEKKWKLGHKGKGFLDIQVLDQDGKSFLMVECKTQGEEYNKAKKDTERDGGQLFGYFIQERNTQYLCLYSSVLENGKIKVFSDIVVINKEIRSTENSQEAFEKWHPQVWETKGIFGEEDKPYKIEFKGILKKELKPLTEKDGGDIYNRFAEILRKNVVSDKTNAFNKIFNLFLCKIVDEYERNNDEEMKFQWQEGERNEDAMLRLNDLYKTGMELYLNLRIEAVSEEELKKELEQSDNKESIKQLFIRQKLYSGNEFALKEVFDKKTFEENCVVVKEVVKLLEKYQIKYSTKQQFLGDFFENLLNTGIKQESGQFFTPIPIAQFICKSIPIRQIIEEKNNRKEPYILPYVIDYASGSGHFLTEAMEEVDSHIKNIEASWIKCGEKHKKEFFKNRDNFDWASEYIYGIEKDYRLAKTTKISTFLNGDGDANVICGDGLDHFQKSKEYRKKLKEMDNEKENRQFDILIANPPYSVDGFKTTLDHGKESFELYPYLTDQSSEIECIFIERAKQLLKDGGMAGIILPISILSNGKIHLRAREILLKYFEIKAIVELGSKTFMATGTKTATLFLRRRGNNDWKIIGSLIDKFFVNFKDITVNGVEKAFSGYVDYVFENLEFKDYVSLFSGKPNEKVLNQELIREYKMHFKKLEGDKLMEAIKEVEKEKMLYFMLTYDQNFVLIRAPSDNNEEKEFLGYEFSTKKGREGIRIYKDTEGKSLTKLYNVDPKSLYDENKINSYILKAFEGRDIPEPTEDLKNILQVQKLHDSLDFDRVNFEKRITTEFNKKKVKIKSKWDLIKLGKLVEILDSKRIPVSKTKRIKGEYPYYGATGIVDHVNEFIFNEKLVLIGEDGAKWGANEPSSFIAEGKYWVNNHAHVLKPLRDKILDKYLVYILNMLDLSSFITGLNVPKLNQDNLKNIQIPLPPLSEQEKIVQEMDAIDKKERKICGEIELKQKKIEQKIDDVFQNEKNRSKLREVCLDILGGGTPSTGNNNYWNGEINWATLVDTKEKYLYSTKRKISEEGLKNSSATILPKNTVIFSSRATIGDITIAKVETSTNQGYKNFVCNPEKLNYEFLYWILKHEVKNIENIASGMTYPEINKTQISNYKIPLSSLSEQEKIVEQIGKIETEQAKLEKKLEELKTGKVNVLKKYL